MATKERRLARRVIFGVDVNVHYGSGVIPGRSVDISASGIAVVLPIELEIGEAVELRFKIGEGTVSTRAILRYRNLLRHGFQFVELLHPLLPLDACQTCGGSGFVSKPVDTRTIALVRTQCPDCNGPS